MQIDRKCERLLKEIERVFPSDQICSSLVISENDEEAQEEVKIFKNRIWNEITAADLWNHAEAYSFFTDQAFKYYLPSVMHKSLVDFKLTHLAVSRVLHRLHEISSDDESKAIKSNFSVNQIFVIKNWLVSIDDESQKYGWAQLVRQVTKNMGF